jgi:hypothetical protein
MQRDAGIVIHEHAKIMRNGFLFASKRNFRLNRRPLLTTSRRVTEQLHKSYAAPH